MLRQELVSLVTTKTTADSLTPELDLVVVENPTTIMRVETRLNAGETMETKASWPWDLSLCSEREFTEFKDDAYFCYCAYVLRISKYSGFKKDEKAAI